MRKGKIIVLTGFSASGKSSVCAYIAKRFSWSCIDLDAEIEKRIGARIAALIAERGEEAFRAIEAEELKKAIRSGVDLIALGGGALLRDENFKLVKENGVVFYLKVSPEVAARRILEDERKASAVTNQPVRPLLSVGSKNLTEDEVRANVVRLMGVREALYQRAADYTLDTSEFDVEKTANWVVDTLERMQAD